MVERSPVPEDSVSLSQCFRQFPLIKSSIAIGEEASPCLYIDVNRANVVRICLFYMCRSYGAGTPEASSNRTVSEMAIVPEKGLLK